jgi:hypothetical protein
MRPGLRSALDLVSVVVVAVLLIGAMLGCYMLADKYGIPESWVYVAWLGFLFIAIIARSVRSMFKHPLFIPYFAFWVVAQTAGSAVAVKEYGMVLAIPAMIFLLFVGYVVTFQLFGVPPEARAKGRTFGDNNASKRDL